MPTNDLSRRPFEAGGVAVASLVGCSNEHSGGDDGVEKTDDESMDDESPIGDGSMSASSGNETMGTETSTDG